MARALKIKKGHGRIISKLRAWAMYAEMRRNGQRVVAVRPRVVQRKRLRLKGQHAAIMFVGSQEAQDRFFKWRARS